MTLGTQRFRLETVDPAAEPYLIGQVTPMGDVLGEASRARALADRVMQRFIRYVEMLQVEEAGPGKRRRGTVRSGDEPVGAAEPPPPESLGEPWALDAEALAEALDAGMLEEGIPSEGPLTGGPAAGLPTDPGARDLAGAGSAQAAEPAPAEPAAAGAGRAREESLDDAARRLTIPDDPTVLSYLLSGIVQIETIRRQGLLEMPTTELRLAELAHLLDREIALLERGLGSYSPDPRLAGLRRN
jgi:hypothetical protein